MNRTELIGLRSPIVENTFIGENTFIEKNTFIVEIAFIGMYESKNRRIYMDFFLGKHISVYLSELTLDDGIYRIHL